MRFLIDENVPIALLDRLQSRGHDVTAIVRVAPSESDTMVLDRARREDCIIVTLDLDFGELIFRDGVAAPPGIVQLRGRPTEIALVIAAFLDLLDGGIDPAEHFVVVEANGKFRRLPLRQD